jgi:hypothetical protein
MFRIEYIRKHYPIGTLVRGFSEPNQISRIYTNRLDYCSRDLHSVWADGAILIYNAETDKYAEIVGFKEVK